MIVNRMKSLMRQSIYVASPLGVDKYGKTTYNTPNAIKCRYEAKNTVTKNSNGQEVKSDTIIITDIEIKENYRVWLDGNQSDMTKSRLVISTKKAIELRGNAILYEVYL